MTARDVWRWTDERGVQRLVSTDELRAALASAILPATTLVWRDGMKEWAPASTVPELASAVFAAGALSAAAPAEKAANREDADPFDARGTLKERERRATLVGLPSPADAAPGDAKVPVAVPAAQEREHRPPVTQVPPFGAPALEVAAVPPPPRVPTAPADPSAEKAEKAKPKRKITTSEVDGLWATTTRSDEDETIPRRARPSELAAAAAAAAEATAALRDGRPRPRPDADARKPAVPLVATGGGAPKPPIASVASVASLATGVPAPKPPVAAGASAAKSPGTTGVPAVRKAPPPPIKSARDDGGPRPQAAGAPPLPPRRVAAPLKPVVPATRVTPPAPPPRSSMREADAPADKPQPIAREPVVFSSTLVGVSPPTPHPAAGPPPLPPKKAETATSPAEPSSATGAQEGGSPPEPVAADKIKTLVSARDSIDSIPGLAEIISVADESSDTAITASINGSGGDATRVTPPSDEELTAPAWPSNGAATAARADAAVRQQATVDLPRRGPEPGAEPVVPPLQAPQGSPEGVSSTAEPQFSPEPSGHPATRPRPPSPPVELALAAVPVRPTGTSDLGSDDRKPAAPRPFDGGPASGPTRRAPAERKHEADVERPAERSVPPPSSDLVSEAIDAPRRPLDEHVSVPLSSLVGAGGLLISMVIAAFFVGRASSVTVARLTAHPSLGAVPAVARAAFPVPLKPCWMVKQPAMWGPQASRSVPFDAMATNNGTLAIGYAHDAHQAVGIEVDLASGEVHGRLDDKAREEIERVVPTATTEFRVTRAGGGPLHTPVEVPASVPFAVGLAEGAIAVAAPPDAAPATLWPVSGDEALGAASVRPSGPRGFALVFRRGGAIWGGFISDGRKAVGELVKVAGSGGAVGKPSTAWNGREVAVIFADRPEDDGHYEIRVGHAPPGAIPATTTVIPLPRGGPGGDAFAPEIAGLSDGRWLLMWTEGAAGARAVRAQTLAPDFTPLGDPIALSPPAGNFGQGVIGLVGAYAATVFLSKGASSYELWGAVLQCGG